MQFSLVITQRRGGQWVETFSDPHVYTAAEALGYGIKLLDNWNVGRPTDEQRMALSAFDIRPATQVPHVWRKTNLVTIKQGRSYFDEAECEVCGLTGRRYGLGSHPVPVDKQGRSLALGRYPEHCHPEEHPVTDYENVTDWYKTADDGPPGKAGLYQTTALPNDQTAVLWRVFDGQMRWGPSDTSYKRAVERAKPADMLMTAPLYWRGLREEMEHTVDSITKHTRPKEGDLWKMSDGTVFVFSERGTWVERKKIERAQIVDHEAWDAASKQMQQIDLSLGDVVQPRKVARAQLID